MNRVVGKLIKDLNIATDPKEVSRVATQQLLGDIVRRIHFQGLDAKGNEIAPEGYSTDPMYVSIAGFVRQTSGKGKKLTPRGKNSNATEFKSGKKRKSRYFEGGYKEFQQEQTGNTKVNFVLTGQLQRDLLMSEAGKNFGLSYSKYGLDIYQGMENKFGVVIWFPTKEEHQRMINAVLDYVNKTL